jgi:hypothetical protein
MANVNRRCVQSELRFLSAVAAGWEVFTFNHRYLMRLCVLRIVDNVVNP